MHRRDILALVGGTATIGTAGCSGFLSDDEPSSAECPTVIDAGKSSGSPSQNVTVEVTVESETGNAVAGVEVRLEDRGGTPDDRSGTTCSDGRIRFVESVGPPPCNRLTLKLPAHDREAVLGCHNGEVDLEHTFTIDA